MKPLSERDENYLPLLFLFPHLYSVGMKPLSERDENLFQKAVLLTNNSVSRNEATL